MRQIRVGILHNGLDSSVQYAEEMQRQITDESVLVDINAPRYLREMLPIRAVPNIMVCLFCEGMEEYQEVVDIINQLDYIRQQDETVSALNILGVTTENATQEAQAAAVRGSMDKVSAALTDEEAVEVKELYGLWDTGIPYYDGTDGEHFQSRVRGRESNSLFRCIQGHTSQADWPPESTPALWSVIDVSHAGTMDDPIPAARGMEYTYGLYYLDPEDGLIYLCKHGEETGAVILQYLPHELAGQYFEAA